MYQPGHVIDRAPPRKLEFSLVLNCNVAFDVTYILEVLCVSSALRSTNRLKQHKASTTAQGFLLSLGAWTD